MSLRNIPELYQQFNEKLLSSTQEATLLQFLIDNKEAADYIRSAIDSDSYSFITRIFNDLQAFPGETSEQFAKQALSYIEAGNFADFFYISSYRLMTALLTEQGFLTEEALATFAKISGTKEPELLIKLYGNPNNTHQYQQRIKIIADQLATACATGVWMIYSNVVLVGKDPNASAAEKKLSDSYAYLTTGFDNEGKLIPPNTKAFQPLIKEISFDKLSTMLNASEAIYFSVKNLISRLKELRTHLENLPSTKKYIFATQIIIDISELIDNYRVTLLVPNSNNISSDASEALLISIKTILETRMIEMDSSIEAVSKKLQDTLEAKESKLLDFLSKSNKKNKETKILQLRQQLVDLYHEKNTLEIFKANVLGTSSTHHAMINAFNLLLENYQLLASKLQQDDEITIPVISTSIEQIKVLAGSVLDNEKDFSRSATQVLNILRIHFEDILQNQDHKKDFMKSFDEICNKFLTFMKKASHEKTVNAVDLFRIDMKNLLQSTKLNPIKRTELRT